MTDMMTLTALNLRDRASRYRALAKASRSDGIADELYALAADYDFDATRLEARLTAAKQAVKFGLN